MTGSATQQAKGLAKEVEGKAQKKVGDAREALRDNANRKSLRGSETLRGKRPRKRPFHFIQGFLDGVTASSSMAGRVASRRNVTRGELVVPLDFCLKLEQIWHATRP